MDELTVLPSVIRHAQKLISNDQNTRACRLLAQALSGVDPITARHDLQLIRAAVLYVATLWCEDAFPDRADTQLTWARYAQTATLASYGTSHPVWQHTATVYADVCTAQGLTFDAAATHRRQLDAYTRYGPAERIPSAWEKLAVALHADGQCDQAHTEIHDAFSYWQHTGLPSQPAGGQLLDTYAGILAGCGHTRQARTLLTDHTHLVAVPGTTDRHAAALITATHIAMAEREHPPVCTARPAQQQPAASPVPDDRWQHWHAILLNPRRTTSRRSHCITDDSHDR